MPKVGQRRHGLTLRESIRRTRAGNACNALSIVVALLVAADSKHLKDWLQNLKLQQVLPPTSPQTCHSLAATMAAHAFMPMFMASAKNIDGVVSAEGSCLFWRQVGIGCSCFCSCWRRLQRKSKIDGCWCWFWYLCCPPPHFSWPEMSERWAGFPHAYSFRCLLEWLAAGFTLESVSTACSRLCCNSWSKLKRCTWETFRQQMKDLSIFSLRTLTFSKVWRICGAIFGRPIDWDLCFRVLCVCH